MSTQPQNSDLIEQYKLYVASAEATSERRLKANTFFLSLHTAVIAAVAYSVYQPSNIRGSVLAVACVIVGLPLCYAWGRMLQSYRRINTCKFEVIGRLEELLPTSPFWKEEWSLLNHEPFEDEEPEAFEKRRTKYAYKPLAAVEAWVPWIVAGAYVLMAGISFVILARPDIVPDDAQRIDLGKVEVELRQP